MAVRHIDEKGTWVKKADEREALAQWLATPKKQRSPVTMLELADHLGVDPATLSIWKNTDRDVAKRVLHLASIQVTDQHSDVMEALMSECLGDDGTGESDFRRPNVKAIEIYFKWAILTNMEFSEEKEKVSAFKRALEVFQGGRVAEMIAAIQESNKSEPIETEVEIVTEEPKSEKLDLSKEVDDGEER